MNKNTIVSESYNLAIEAGFNSYLEEHATSENCEIKIDEEKLITQIETDWLETKLAELGDITPKEYIDSISSLKDLVEFFIVIASISDTGVPEILIEKLEEYGKSAADMLFGFVRESINVKILDKGMAISQSVYAIGRIRCDEYKQPLIELLIESCKDEMVSEAICNAISSYGGSIIGELIKTFNNTEHSLVKEHLLTCVAEISRDYKSDEVFYFLKNAFRVISNLKLAAEVLGDYGDGRAIPLLRGYINKNIKEMDKSTFNHIRAVIKKLGGEIDDLVYKV